MSETSLSERILDGDVRAASRLMRNLDDDMPGVRAELDALFPHRGAAEIVGVTGHPGSGKSTLVNRLIGFARSRGETVGCIAVDPTSPFSGGALLGDRVRMNDHALDDGVFIRSVATRGNLGGLSRSTPALVLVMDAMGFDRIFIETVGVGQDEIDIVQLADTNVVVMAPGLGDDIQATKAGLLEIADIFAINKSDLDGAQRVRRDIQTMLRLGPDRDDDDRWRPPVIPTVATKDEGTDDLFEAFADHRRWLTEHGTERARRTRRLTQLVRLVVAGRLDEKLDALLEGEDWKSNLDEMLDGSRSPYAVADDVLDRLFESGKD